MDLLNEIKNKYLYNKDIISINTNLRKDIIVSISETSRELYKEIKELYPEVYIKNVDEKNYY